MEPSQATIRKRRVMLREQFIRDSRGLYLFMPGGAHSDKSSVAAPNDTLRQDNQADTRQDRRYIGRDCKAEA